MAFFAALIGALILCWCTGLAADDFVLMVKAMPKVSVEDKIQVRALIHMIRTNYPGKICPGGLFSC